MRPCNACPALRRSRSTIKRLNGGRWPADVCDWRAVYRQCGLRIHLVRSSNGIHACLVEEATAIIEWTPDRALLSQRLCHELVEYLTRSDIAGPEMRVCPGLQHHDLAEATATPSPDMTCQLNP